MRKNILTFPESSQLSALTRYDRSLDPADFLDAIEETFRNKSALAPLMDRLVGFIESVKAKQDHGPVLSKACTLLAKCSFSPLAKPSKKIEQPSDQAIREKEKARGKALFDVFRKRNAKRQELHDNVANTPYGAYPPAYPYVDAIPQVFGENDPVRIASEYLNALQPIETFRHPHDCWFSDDERISVNGNERNFFLHQFLPKLVPEQWIEDPKNKYEIAFWTAVNILDSYFGGALKSIPENHPVFDFSFPSGKRTDQISGAEGEKFARSVSKGLFTIDGFLLLFFGNHFEIPQGLFVAVVRYWLDNEIGISESDASRSILRSLVNFPLGRPAQSWGEVSSGVADAAWLEKVKRIYKEPSLVPFLPCGMSTFDWFFRLSDSAVPIQFRYDNGAEFLSLVLDAWSKKIGILRNYHLGGRYPWRVRSDVRYLYDDHEVSSPDWDTCLHFMALFVEEEEAGEWGWEDDFYGDNRINCFRSFKLHRNFWLAADREGYPELGNALLAFYLLRKSLLDATQHHHLEVDWVAFSNHIRIALMRPGHDWVRRGIEFMKAICRDKEWNLDLLRLNNIVPDSAEIISFPVSTSLSSVEPIGAKVNRTIEQQVGGELWNRFSIRSRKLLIEAEVRFQNIAQTIGSGITEFGPETLAYARPFENELNERLQNIYRSSEVIAYWFANNPKRPLPTNPTIGSYLRLLESEMPAEVIELIEAAGVTLHRKPDLLNRLSALKDRRDQGGHTSKKVTSEHLFGQRVAVFEEQLLRDFLSALSSRATV